MNLNSALLAAGALMTLAYPRTLHAAAVDTTAPQQAAATLNQLLAADWQAHKVTANPQASDETLVRRLYLDIVGRIPTLAETLSFLADTASDKRARLIDTLLASEGHTLHFFHWWADLLRLCHSNPGTSNICGREYAQFIKESLRANKPYDQIVRELLTAGGNVWENPAIGYAMRDRGMPLDHAANTTRIFLGTRIECAQCHNHPFDKWTQKQFFQNAAYTHAYDAIDYYSPTFDEAKKRVTDLQKKDGPQSHRWLYASVVHSILPLRNATVKWFDNQPLKLPHDYQYADAKPLSAVPPATLMGSSPDLSKHRHSTAAYAQWLTAPENPRFTRVIANRMWKKVFGRGLIEPADEILDSTQPSHPALMTALEELMVRQRYDLRAFLRVLYNTRAYQGQVTRAELQPGEDYRFTGPLLSRMSAEQIWDSLVSLVHPAVDAPNEAMLQRLRLTMAACRKLDDALKAMPAKEMLDRAAREVVPIVEAQNAKVSEIQSRLAAARADRKTDPAVLRAIGIELTNSMGGYHRALSDHILVPATLRLAERANGGKPVPKPAPPNPAAVQKQVTQTAFSSLGAYEHIRIPGYDEDEPTAADTKAAHQRLFQAEAERLGIPAKEQPAYIAYRFKVQPEWFRAAELPSPAPPGHVLREMGQSDREVIENASTEASIPQALIFMNSPLQQDLLSPHSLLKRGLTTDAAKLSSTEAIYLTLLSRRPTTQELAALEKSGLDSPDDLIIALLNTRQFIYIQ
jgi:hypothetical protein